MRKARVRKRGARKGGEGEGKGERTEIEMGETKKKK